MNNIKNLTNYYKEIRNNPLSLLEKMNFDEYCDWLDLGDKKDLEATLVVFLEKGLDKAYIRVIEYKLKRL